MRKLRAKCKRATICRDDHGRTALHWAAAHGLVQEAKALLVAADNLRTAQQTMAADGISAEVSQNPELPRLALLQVLQKQVLLLGYLGTKLLEAQEMMILFFAYDKSTVCLEPGKLHASAAHLHTIFTSAMWSAAFCS